MAGSAVPATASVVSPSTIVVAANPSNPTGVAEATAAHASAATLRRAVGKLLNRYLADYGDRLSKAELARMRFLAKDAELAFTKAQESSVTTLDEVQPMLQSKLGLFEALSAKGDLDEQMARYDALGVQIRKVSAAYGPERSDRRPRKAD